MRRPETVLLLEELARCERFLDVGANTGLFSIAGCATNSRLEVIAVEALPNQCTMFRNNVALNGFGGRIRIKELALADHDGVVDFHEAEDCTMGSLNTKGYQGQQGNVISVRCTTLDQLLTEESFHPDLVKVDVEGFEDVVLSGGEQMLSVTRPRMVIEVNEDMDCTLLVQLFAKHRYAVQNITAGGLIPSDRIFPSSDGNNWLCIPKR